MKKVININFQGRVVPIEETAYELLQTYIGSLRKYFANEEGKDEIINDIESRIAELFAEVLKKGSTCITDADVNNIIDSMGRPEDFDSEEDKVQSQLGGNATQQQTTGSTFTASGPQEPKRLYRDESNKVFGGVCSGIANYFGIDPIIVRIITVLTLGVVFIPYIVLWAAVPSTATQVIGSTRKRLFRDSDNKIIAGVNGGLANYFGINVWIPRILFLIPFFSFAFGWKHIGFFDFPDLVNLSFSPGATLLYIILWLVLPEAVTAAEKLEMKGERVDLNSIKNTIQTDMEGFKGRAEKFGNDLKDRARQMGDNLSANGQQMGAEASYVARRASRGLGDVIALIAKIFAYFILALVIFVLVVTLFSIGVVFTGMLPLKDYLIAAGVQNVYAIGTLILFIWVPVIGIITWIVRRVAKIRRYSSIVRYSFLALWVAGWFCLAALLNSLHSDFRYHNRAEEQNVALTNPKVNKLEVKLTDNQKYYGNNHWFKMEPFVSFDDDTVFVKNVRIRVKQSTNDSFYVTLTRLCDGTSKSNANKLAQKIQYNIAQKDSFLLLDRGIPVNTIDKFRNQRVIITIAVPVGKKILIRDNAGWNDHITFGDRNDEWNWHHEYNETDDWDANVEYIMTTSGLQRTQPKEYHHDDNEDSYEEYKRNKEELRRQIEEKKRELNEQQRELDEKQRELNAQPDTTRKYKYQKSVFQPNIHKIKKLQTCHWC